VSPQHLRLPDQRLFMAGPANDTERLASGEHPSSDAAPLRRIFGSSCAVPSGADGPGHAPDRRLPVCSRTRHGSATYAAADPAVALATRLDQVAGYTAFAAVSLVPLAAFGGFL
jgi:hypothetical protein